MNKRHCLFTALLIAGILVSACGPSAGQVATTNAAMWTATPPYPAAVQAQAEQAFARGATVYLYDPQPTTVSRADLDNTEFSLRYILSRDAMEVTNFIFIWKVNAEGTREFIIPERSSAAGTKTIYLMDWLTETGTLTFTTFSSMADTSDQMVVDPDVTVFTTWIITWDSLTALYAQPNPLVEDPVYLDVLLLSPELRDEVLLLSDASQQLSNPVRIPVNP